MVLLKNDGVLPLDKGDDVAFIGEFARRPRFQGGGPPTSTVSKPHSRYLPRRWERRVRRLSLLRQKKK